MKNIFVSFLISIICCASSSFAQNSTGLHLYDNVKKELNYRLIENNNSQLFLIHKPSVIVNKISGDTTEECSIILNNGSLLKDVRLLGSDDTTFAISKRGVNRIFRVEQLNRITFERHGFWKGFAYGGLASVIFWGALGLINTHHGGEEGWNLGPGFGFLIGIVLAVPTGLITGIISEFATTNDVYDFGNINPLAKPNLLRDIILKHKD